MKLVYNGNTLAGGTASPDGLPIRSLSREEYDALTDEEKEAEVLYLITDVTVNDAPTLSIEEYDTSDGWHVRKWSDGYVEMDYSLVVSQYDGGWQNTSMGNGTIYATRQEFRSPDYPLPLTKVFFKDVKVNAGWYAWAGDATNTDPNTIGSDTVGCYVLTTQPNMITAKRDFIIMFHLTGRWR